jgi:hypothetical protein
MAFKNKLFTNQAWSIYTNSYVEYVSNSGTTLWNAGKEGKEKIIEYQ